MAIYLGDYFNTLTFGHEQHFVVVQLSQDENADHRNELSYLFDLIALQSKWIEAYDEEPEYWERTLRQQLTPSDLKEINRIRRRFRLSQIPDHASDAETQAPDKDPDKLQ